MKWYRIYYKYNALNTIFTQVVLGSNELFKQIDLIINIFKAEVLKVVSDNDLNKLNNRYLHDIKQLEGDL